MACRHRSSRPVSFYYWRTSFYLNSTEREALRYNAVETLYVRYFDVDFAPGEVNPQPVSPISFDTSVHKYQVVPVIYLKNRTFERLDSTGVVTLSKNTFRLVSGINQAWSIKTNQIQFDCDWTEKTKDKYFLLLRQYRIISKQLISATVRLHQVKYPQRTGIPPVDHGVLMYYNMGDINSGSYNSIYESSVADRYNLFIRSYALTLDIAMPVFSWALKIRDGKVVQLLNKINFSHFKNDSNFISIKNNRFLVKHACFKGGYYFRENDEVKIENISSEDLLEIAAQINRHSGNKTRNLIFYDLDSTNLINYEKDIFKEILDNTD